MVIKVKCCRCGDMLSFCVHDENRNKATSTKKYIKGKALCRHVGYKCKPQFTMKK